MEIHRKMWSEQLMNSYTSAVRFSTLFQQPVKIIRLAASKNSEYSLKANIFFLRQYMMISVWELPMPKYFTAAVYYLLKQVGNIYLSLTFVLEKLC